MHFTLRITGDQLGERTADLNPGEYLVGRSRSADIRVYAQDVSGKQFLLKVSETEVRITNLSSHGTLVDKKPMKGEVVLTPGACIIAGHGMFFYLEAMPEIAGVAVPEETEVGDETSATRFAGMGDPAEVGDETGAMRFAGGMGGPAEVGDETSATRFAGMEHPAEVGDETGATRFAGMGGPAEVGDETGATHFAGMEDPAEVGDETGATRFAGMENPAEVGDETGAMRFAGMEHPAEVGDETGATRFAGMENPAEVGDETGATRFAGMETDREESADETGATRFSGAVFSTGAGDTNYEEGMPREEQTGHTTGNADTEGEIFSTASQPGISALSEDTQNSTGREFVVEEDEDGEKTGGNATQAVQTRMANLEEINYIRRQLEHQRQSRVFLRFVLFVFLLGMAVLVWVWRAPKREKDLSWSGKVGFEAAFSEKGVGGTGFSLYYPDWSVQNSQLTSVEKPDSDTILVHTFLGKKAEVSLELALYRWNDGATLHIAHRDAWRNAQDWLQSKFGEAFTLDNVPEQGFFTAKLNQNRQDRQNGIFYTSVKFQRAFQEPQGRPQSRQWHGRLYFFRTGATNYVLMAEVPDAEKTRAASTLDSDPFMLFSTAMERLHWSGDGKEAEIKDIQASLDRVEEEIGAATTNFYYLEFALRHCLIQLAENPGMENHGKLMETALRLLGLLRDAEQKAYNQLKLEAWGAPVGSEARKRVRQKGMLLFKDLEDRRLGEIESDLWR